jgi:hypothetical protein
MHGFFISWVPKIGAAIGMIGGMLTANGETTYGPLLTSVGIFVVGLSSRQDGKTSEDVGITAPAVVIRVEPPIVVMEKTPTSTPPRRQ